MGWNENVRIEGILYLLLQHKDTCRPDAFFICNFEPKHVDLCFCPPLLNKTFCGPQIEIKWGICAVLTKPTEQYKGNVHSKIFVIDSTSKAWADQISELSLSVLLTCSYTQSLQVHRHYKVSLHDMWNVQRQLKSYNTCTHFLTVLYKWIPLWNVRSHSAVRLHRKACVY